MNVFANCVKIEILLIQIHVFAENFTLISTEQ